MKFKTFNDLVFDTQEYHHPSYIYMERARLFFPNGYGCSVIRGTYSYGGEEGLYELAVLKGNEHKSNICYDTPITSDVIGYLNPAAVSEIMIKIQELKK